MTVKMENSDSDSSGYIENFLQFLKIQKNISENTLLAYRRDAGQFFLFLEKRGIGIKDADKIAVRDYLAQLSGGMKKSTVIRKIAVMRGLFGFIVRCKIIPSSPMDTIFSPKKDGYLPNFLTVEEVERLISSAAAAEGAAGQRDWAILELLYSSGMRVSELTGLNKGDVDFIAGCLKVTGKGSKQRIVPLGDKALGAVRKYLALRTDDTQALFTGRKFSRITPRCIQLMLKKYLRLAGIDRDITPHSLRHTFATHLLDAGCDIRSVQEMLGHKSITTTQIYTHVTASRMKKIYDKVHPRS